MLKNRFLKNTSWILFGQIIRLIISFVISVITARYLGPSNNGVLNYVSSHISFFVAIAGLGLNGVIIHEFVNHRDDEGKILGTAILLRFLFGVISVIAFLFFIWCMDGYDKTIMIVAALQAIELPFLCLDTINYWYQSKMESKYSTFAQTAAYILMAVYKVYLLATGKSVVWFAFAVSLDIIILGVLYLALYNQHKTQKLDWDKKIAKRLLMSGFPFILANLMAVIYGQMDRVMIKQLMDSTAEVGLYSAAITICAMIGFIPIAILDSARPLIAEAKNEGEEKYKLRFRQLVAGIMWLCIAYSVFVTALSEYIVYYMFGIEYMDSNICLKITVWYTAFSYLGSARNFWLICEDKKKYVFIFSAMGAVLNVTMNFAFIPMWGINGAAIATLATQIIANFVIPLAFKDTREYGKSVVDALSFRNLKVRETVSAIAKKK